MVKLRKAYYFGVQVKCNFFVAEGISVDFPKLDARATLAGRVTCNASELAPSLRVGPGQAASWGLFLSRLWESCGYS